MLELIGTAVVFWVIWKLLDTLFTRKPKPQKDAAGQFIVQADDGHYYLVKEVEPEPEQPLPDNVVELRRR